MPIEGPTLERAARDFCDHLNRLLARTITQTRLISVARGRYVQIAFRQRGRPIQARLNSRFGPVNLYVGQTCGSVVTNEGKHRLYTEKYAYTLTPEGATEPVWRWEYVRRWPENDKYWCRHHLQGEVNVSIHNHQVSLNDIHLPTGYMTVEELIRFCIVDLQVSPLSEEWHEILEESYQQFKYTFAPRRE